MNSFKNNIKKSALSFKVIVVCLLLSGSLITPGYATTSSVNCTTGFFTIEDNVVTAGAECVGEAIIPSGVTSINAYTFANNSGLTSITIPDSVTDISQAAFESTGLTSVTFAGIPILTTIGESVFANNPGLTSITIPNSVLEIDDFAFRSNTLLASVTIPNGVTTIGDYAFYGNIALTEVIIPNSVTIIGDGAFNESGLTEVIIPNSVTIIGADAFSGNTALTSVTIGNSVITIGSGAFYGNILLASVIIPDSVTSIGSDAFAGNTSLISVTIGNSVITIGSAAFYGNILLTSVTIGSSVAIIGNSAFYNNTALTSVIIGNSVTRIGNSAFQGNTALTAVTIPDSVTSIGNDAFRGNTALTSVNIGNSVASIGNGVFQDNTALTSVTIPDSVTEIGASAFLNSNLLASVTFLGIAALTNAVVGDGAFSGVAVGAIANVAYNATGFPADGSTWNGLIVRYASAPAGDSGSSSPTTVATITPADVKIADASFKLTNRKYLSKFEIRKAITKGRSFKRKPIDFYKYSISKTSKKNCVMSGNYVMALKKTGACEIWVTRTTPKGAKYKYWVKINYSK